MADHSFEDEDHVALRVPMRHVLLMRLRARKAMAVCELAEGMPISRPAVSQHLRALKEAGLVSVRSEGARRIYRIV
jgi:DNA-binding transcriptional ArsR family regulator